MVGLFISPQGRATSGQFWVGVIVLLVIGLALGAAANFGPPNLQMPLALISIVLIYPQLCVFAKRLHDAGKSAWWYLAILAVYIVISFGAGIALSAPYFGQIQAAANDQAQLAAVQAQMTQSIYLPSQAIGVVSWLIISFLVGNLRSDPGENKYGPPVTAAA
jgi:uncharacterized membrane protein YhaH (DUF805 family)